MRFKGKSALVCGAGGGIGLATARGLLSAGLNVALADIKDEPKELADGPGQASYYQGDLSNENFVRSVVEQTASAQGGIDYLVNTTGVLWFGRDASVTEMDMDLWDQVFAFNLKSFALSARHVVPHMQAGNGGAMVHIASIDALRGDGKPQDAYGAAKAGVNSLMRSIAIEYGRQGIRANAIAPSAATQGLLAWVETLPGGVERFAEQQPMGRLGTPEDIASVAAFLASDYAGFVNGVVLPVDGGIEATLAVPG